MLTLLFIITSAIAAQVINYELTIEGNLVGTREVSIQYLDPLTQGGEPSRLIKSYEQLEVREGSNIYQLDSRVSARHSSRRGRVTTVAKENGAKRQIEVKRDSKGKWTISNNSGGGVTTQELLRHQVTGSTLDFLDPQRYEIFRQSDRAAMVDVYSGQLIAGTVESLGDGTIQIAGQPVLVSEYKWHTPYGVVVLSWSVDGLLLGYEMDYLGRTLQARATTVPPVRTFGDMAPVLSNTGVVEEEL